MAERLKIKYYLGCFSDDNLPVNIKDNEGLVVNYQSSDEPGSHWCAIKRMGKTLYHFDSLAFPPDTPLEILAKKNKLSIKSEYIRLQLDASHYCGHYCLLFLLCIEEPDDIPVFYNQFDISETSTALQMNDKLIRSISIDW